MAREGGIDEVKRKKQGVHGSGRETGTGPGGASESLIEISLCQGISRSV